MPATLRLCRGKVQKRQTVAFFFVTDGRRNQEAYTHTCEINSQVSETSSSSEARTRVRSLGTWVWGLGEGDSAVGPRRQVEPSHSRVEPILKACTRQFSLSATSTTPAADARGNVCVDMEVCVVCVFACVRACVQP